jgi:hypothetical protein
MKTQAKEVNLLNSPWIFLTTYVRVTADELKSLISNHRRTVATFLFVAAAYWSLHFVPKLDREVATVDEVMLFAGFWILLGVLSSIGLGTGLHTFVLYLGPKIVKFVLASNKCGAVCIMEPSRFALFPDFACPRNVNQAAPPTFFSIFSVIFLEGMLWGIGTAIGELPPYYISRMARLAGKRNDEYEEITNEPSDSFLSKIKKKVFDQVQRNSFLTVFLLASFPNPLFDLAGITCGHLLVPFGTFIAATTLGKAIVKANLQVSFFIFMFSQSQIGRILSLAEKILGAGVAESARNFIERQQAGILRKLGKETEDSNWLSTIWNLLLAGMLIYFLYSIVDAKVKGVLRTNKSLDRKSVE